MFIEDEFVQFVFIKTLCKRKQSGNKVSILKSSLLFDERLESNYLFQMLLEKLKDENYLDFVEESNSYTISLKWNFYKFFDEYMIRVLATYVILDNLYKVVKDNPNQTQFLLNTWILDDGHTLPPSQYILDSDSYYVALTNLYENGVLLKVKVGFDDDYNMILVEYDPETIIESRAAFIKLFDQMLEVDLFNYRYEYIENTDTSPDKPFIVYDHSIKDLSVNGTPLQLQPKGYEMVIAKVLFSKKRKSSWNEEELYEEYSKFQDTNKKESDRPFYKAMGRLNNKIEKACGIKELIEYQDSTYRVDYSRIK